MPNAKIQTPLWLPTGSVRSIIALGLVGACVAITIITKTFPKELGVLTGVVITFYFTKS